MHKVKVNKHYNGLLSVRDYECIKGMKQGGLIIEHKGKIAITVQPDSIRNALQSNKNKSLKSKFPPYSSYRLVDFRFSGFKNNEKQRNLI